MTRVKSTCLALVAVLISPMAANADLIDFTEVPLSNGTTVTNEWAAYGITLSNAYFYIDSRDTFDGKGVANSGGTARIDFDSLISGLTIDWVNISTGIEIRSFNSAGDLLALFSSGGDTGTTGDMGSNIAYMTWNNNGGAVGVSTLRFTVPEPGTLALLGLGLVGIAARRRRKAQA